MPHNRCAERTGLSVVVPSASRGPTLHVLLIALLQQEALRVPGSEIIVSHATFDSLNEAPNMSPRVLAACASCDVRRIVHVDSVRINDALGCAHRYVVASKHARNNVLLHLDDDLLPKAALLQALVQSVCAEPGFPEYARTSRPNPFRSAPPRPSFYGTTPRLCSKDGYRFYSRRYTLSQRGKWVLQKPYYVLTNVASMSRALNAEFVAVLNQSYASLMRVTGGEGCDLVFNHFARGAGSTPTALRGHLHTRSVENIRRPKHLQAAAEARALAVNPVDSGNQSKATAATATSRFHSGYEGGKDHYPRRWQICTCLGRGTVGETLVGCATDKAGLKWARGNWSAFAASADLSIVQPHTAQHRRNTRLVSAVGRAGYGSRAEPGSRGLHAL